MKRNSLASAAAVANVVIWLMLSQPQVGLAAVSTPAIEAASRPVFQPARIPAPANILNESGQEQVRQLEREQERARVLRQQQETAADIRLPREAPLHADHIPSDEMPCFPIETIVLQGLRAEAFGAALRTVTAGPDPATGRCLGAAGINAVLIRVQNAIVAQGFITTRVLAGPQNLRSGELILTVLPGQVHAVRFADSADPRGTKWNAMPMRPDDLLNLRDIEQGLENLKRVPTADADIQIEPSILDAAVDQIAEKTGQSDLVIQYRQVNPFRLNLSVDDGGSSATGKYQAGATVSYDNWWTLNDLFYFSLNGDLGGGTPEAYGTRSYTGHYSIPFGYWALAFTAGANRYFQKVAAPNQTYVYSGRSETKEIKLSRVLYRDALRKTTLSLRGMLRSSNNFIDDTEIGVQQRRTAAWEVALAHRVFLGDAALNAGMAYRRGTGAFDAMQAPEDQFNEGTSRFKIITGDLGFSMPFRIAAPWGAQSLRYTGSLNGQWNNTPLTSQDRFSIGGRYSVRGFDGEMTLLAERGWLLRNDLGTPVGDSGQEAYIGVDYGAVGGRSSAFLLGTRLAGAVVGLRGNGPDAFAGLYYDVFIGTPLSKPAHFQTASLTTGFNLSWSY